MSGFGCKAEGEGHGGLAGDDLDCRAQAVAVRDDGNVVQGGEEAGAAGCQRRGRSEEKVTAVPDKAVRRGLLIRDRGGRERFIDFVEGVVGLGRLAAVVGGGFGVDEQAVDFGRVEFERAFERGDDGVDARHGEVVGQGAVAADLDVIAGSVVRGARVTKTSWMSRISGKAAAAWRRRTSRSRSRSSEAGRSMVAGSLSMWVRMEVIAGTSRRISASRSVTSSWAWRSGMVSSTSRCCSTWRPLSILLHADLVDGEVAAGGDGADAVVDALGDRCGGDGVDDDVGAGKVALDGFGGGHGELLGALEGEVARHAEGDVGEVVGAGAAGAQAVDGQDAGDRGEIVDEVAAECLGLRRLLVGLWAWRRAGCRWCGGRAAS